MGVYCIISVMKNKIRYTIGLDVGTASVGWAVYNNEMNRIEDLGVRTFESAEDPQKGDSLALPRRLARGARRRIDRRGYRLSKIKGLFEKYGILTAEEIRNSHQLPNNPYKIRAEALDKLIPYKDLFIAIYHIAKRRGYKSNRKKIIEGIDEAAKNESKTVLDAIGKNKELLKQGGYNTVGQMLYKDSRFETAKRNKPGSYANCILRDDLINEVNIILGKQKEFGNKKITDDFIKDILNTVSYQRPFASGDILKDMVGKCTFEKDEIRAAKSTPTFQLFNVLQKINHIRIKDRSNGIERLLTEEERKAVLDKIKSKKSETNFGDLRKILSLNDNEIFNISYFIKKKKGKDKDVTEVDIIPTDEEIIKTSENGEKIPKFDTFYKLKERIEKADFGLWKNIEENLSILDKIAETLTLYKTDEDIISHLREIGDIKHSDNAISSLLDLSFDKFGHISLKALYKITPFLERGDTYDEACNKAGYDFRIRGQNDCFKLPPLNEEDHYSLTNPVVRRSVTQTIKVVNAIIDMYDSPEGINLELARDLSKDLSERRKIQKIQDDNRKGNESAEKAIKENYNLDKVAGQDILKMRLYKSQNGICLYSGKVIEEKRLFENGYVQIDHIIPFSRSFDDSFNNKALVLTEENQNKLNRTPYEWLGSDSEAWGKFEARINSLQISFRKKQNLLTKKYVSEGMNSRSLNDTRYASRFLKNYIQRNLTFAESDKGNKVLTINGEATAYIRKRLGLGKDRQENDKHHAQDAAIASIISKTLIDKINYFAKLGEISKYLEHGNKLDKIRDCETGSDFDENVVRDAEYFIARHNRKSVFIENLDDFRKEITARMSDDPKTAIMALSGELEGYKYASDLSFVRPIFVSRMPKHKITGRAHAETLLSPRYFNQGEAGTAKRINLTKLKLKNIDNIVGEGKDIKEKLSKRLVDYGNDPEKAFGINNPFYRPSKDGSNGPLMRSVTIKDDSQKSGLLINERKALVAQDSMIRVDIFSKPNKKGKDEFYIVPIYAYHFANKELPNKAIIGGKPEFDWEEMTDEYKFKFSLYPNDLVKLTKGDSEKFGYYIKTNRAIAAIDIESPNNSMIWVNNGLKTIDNIEKYVVDILGRYYPIKQEKRQGISIKPKGNTTKKNVLESNKRRE